MTPDVAVAFAFLVGLVVGGSIALAGVWVGFKIMKEDQQ